MSAIAFQYEATPAPSVRGPASLARMAAFALLSAACTWFSIRMTRFDGGVAALWLSSGLLTGVLLSTPRQTWRAWLVAALVGQTAARVANGGTLALAVVVVAINLLESGIVAAWVMRRMPALGQGRSLGRMARDAVIATVVACLLSATLAAPLLQYYVQPGLLASWLSWFTAHLLGMMIMATLTVCALQPKISLFGRTGTRTDYALCFVLMLATCVGAFSLDRFPLLFLPLLPLQLLVWRHGLSGMMAGVVALAVTSGLSSASGHGPFKLEDEKSALEHVLFWQSYLAAACALAYSTSVAMARRRVLERQLQQSEARHRQMAEDADRLARYDALTGLANRRYFDEALPAALARAARNGAPLELLGLDVDHFKAINDTFGHAAGDKVLAEFASRLSDCVFDVDLVARLGGDEFVVLVEYSASSESGELIARRVLDAMREPILIDGEEITVGVSIGIGLHAPARSPERVMRLADQALYEAKARGRNTWSLQRD